MFNNSDIDKLTNSLEQMLLKAIEKGLEDTVEEISKQSVKEAPVDTGDLRESFSVKVDGSEIIKGTSDGNITKSGQINIEKTTKKINIEFEYDSEYAAIQHEMYEKKVQPGTKTKYLSDPLNNESKNLSKNIKKNLK